MEPTTPDVVVMFATLSASTIAVAGIGVALIASLVFLLAVVAMQWSSDAED